MRGIQWALNKGGPLASYHSVIGEISTLLIIPSLASFRSSHWNHTSWNAPNSFFALNIHWEKKQKHITQKQQQLSDCLFLSNFDWILLFLVNSKEEESRRALTVSQIITTTLPPAEPFISVELAAGTRRWGRGGGRFNKHGTEPDWRGFNCCFCLLFCDVEVALSS